jgi:hypothetical protein
MTRPRFSLRGLLLLTVAVATVCWYRDLPRQNGERFARLFEASDYESAFALFNGGDYDPRPPWLTRASGWTVTTNAPSPRDWLRGRYPVYLTREAEDSTATIVIESRADGLHRSDIPLLWT